MQSVAPGFEKEAFAGAKISRQSERIAKSMTRACRRIARGGASVGA
jgi:hypothetical protein